MLFKKFKPLHSKRTLFAIFLIVLCFSLVPTNSKAIFGIGDVGLFDLATMQLDALDFVDSVVLRIVTYIGILIVESSVFIKIGASILQWAVDLPIYLNNALVRSGWGFIRDLTNLFFILAMVFISMAFILKTETFGMKKALPGLIVAALLVNFSLLLVGGVVDIAQVFQNTLKNAFGGVNFISSAIQPLDAGFVAAWFFAIPTAIIVSAFFPYLNVFISASVGTLFFADIFAGGGIFLRTFLLIGLNFIVGSIFFFYSALFLLRIVFLWILAIFSPLAFFASVFPSTKKYWNQWLHLVLSWSFLGIIAFFLIGLGLKLFAITGNDALLKWGEDINTKGGSIPSFIYNYLFLIIYMGAAFFVSKKFVPMGADIVMKQAGELMGKGIKAFGKTRTAGQAAEGIARAGKWGEGAEREALRLEGLGKTGRANFVRWTGRRAQAFGKGVSFVTTPVRPAILNYAAGMRKIALPKNWKQMTIDDKVASIEATRRDEDKFVQIHAMGEEGTLQKSKGLWDLANNLQEKFKNDSNFLKERGDLVDILTNTITADIKINLEVGEKAQKDMEIKINAKATEIASKKLGKDASLITATERAPFKDSAARYTHYMGLKSSDWKGQSKDSVESLEAGEALRDGAFQNIQAIQENFKTETLNKVIDNTFGEMFKGKNDEESKKILDDYYDGKNVSDPKIASAHKKMVQWAAGNIIGRSFNLPFRDHMTDIDDQLTTNFIRYENQRKIKELIKGNAVLQSAHTAMSNMRQAQKKLREQTAQKSTVRWQALTTAEKTIFNNDLKDNKKAIEDIRESINIEKENYLRSHPEDTYKWQMMETMNANPNQGGRNRT